MHNDNESLSNGNLKSHNNAVAANHAPQDSNKPLSSETEIEGKPSTALQSDTSRANSKGGPATLAGKQKASRNSLRDGIFSRQVVIAELGEKREEFEKFKRAYFECFQPTNEGEEQFANDFVENTWCRERVRKAEEQARCDRLETFQLQHQLKRTDEVEKLTVRFLSCFENYVFDISTTLGPLPVDLEDVRQELMWTSQGIDFLLKLLQSLAVQLRSDGVLSSWSSVLLRVIGGPGYAMNISAWIDKLVKGDPATCATNARECDLRNNPARDNTEDGRSHADDDRLSREETKLVQKGIAMHIKSIADTLNDRKKKLQVIEQAEIRRQMSLLVLDPSSSERYSRAETRRERGMHKALGAFAALRASALLPTLSLPEGDNSSPILDQDVSSETGEVN